jgi:hypothetical protein
MTRKVVTSRVLRDGQDELQEQDWLAVPIEERIEAVWTLTKICLAWSDADCDEPRLQRSVSRAQRLPG